ncbi:dihydroorotase [Ligilactobacillus apodemi]|uniref:Dihydroorotase n=1 Tax=Ligilactobacillus apodemi DSM 16634 = JCM 16172 TaxID=1423724 RepID=A0A0R1TRQ6_9LACO|nr:dihydroorotase [Ligilactobacillus apodemi]KRL83897.1 dihydroorotase [Ligilactobacillus apodemi DSM 16634 = JCM 16172]
MKTLIKNGTVYQNGKLLKNDLLLEDDKITLLGTDLSDVACDQVIDAQNKLVAPGLVDVHVHYREPGFTHKETIKTGSLAAAHGGYTTVCAMPNLDPVPDTPEKVSELVALNKQDGVVNIKQYGAITKGLKSDQLLDYAGMKASGAFAFSNDGCGVQTAGTMYQAMLAAKKLGVALVAHVEDNSLLFGGVMNAGKRAKELGLPGILGISESSQIARDLLLAKETGVHYHVCHVSTKESVELVRLAKAHGINVTCEVSPHHLLLNEEDIPANDGFYKMNPPLRANEDQQALIAGILDGTIDMIATDHAPHSIDEKTGDMRTSAFGITGSETAFALLYTRLVKQEKILTLAQLLDLMAKNPAEKFNFAAGVLYAGATADIAIFDLENEFELKEEYYFSKGKNTPFTGQKVYGETYMTLVNGKVAYQKED